MKYFAVIDTNVLVSAMLKQTSVPGSIVSFAFDGPIIPVLNQEIENEYRNVLLRPKFHLTEDIVNDIISEFQRKGLYLDAETIDIELPDPKDRVFYEVVMEERKEEGAWLVTGNTKHFPVEPFIVTPRQMLDIILADYDKNNNQSDK